MSKAPQAFWATNSLERMTLILDFVFLTFTRRYVFYSGDKIFVTPKINWSMLSRGNGRVFTQIVFTIRICRWANRPAHKIATTVRADLSQKHRCTTGAKRAFERAYDHICRIRGKSDVAVLARGS